MYSLNIPKNVNISWGNDFVKISGVLGTAVKKKEGFNLAIKESKLYIWNSNQNSNDNLNSYFLYLKNIITGVSIGYCQKLKLIGVGYRAAIQKNTLILKLGFSHEVSYKIPEDVQIYAAKTKGTFLLIKGADKFRVNHIAAEIKNLRAPDVYKGKGVHYENEILRLKKGKREGK